jgi:cytochrome P450
MKDHTFCNGVTIPAGTALAAPGFPTHADEENYLDAKEFKPWRYAEKRSLENERTKHQFSAPSLEYSKSRIILIT